MATLTLITNISQRSLWTLQFEFEISNAAVQTSGPVVYFSCFVFFLSAWACLFEFLSWPLMLIL